MADFTTDNIMTLAVAAVMILGLVLYSRRHKDKDVMGMFFGVRKKKPEQEKKAEPKAKNGTRAELTNFVADLIRTAGKNKMKVVAPARVEYEGKTSRLTAFVVSPSGVTGVYCLGFGGIISAAKEPKPWKQQMNGQERTFENPTTVCKEQYELVKAAMDNAGIKAELDMVTVFTNTGATLATGPSATVYSQKSFLAHLKNTDALKRGSLDVEETAKALAVLADIKGQRKRKK